MPSNYSKGKDSLVTARRTLETTTQDGVQTSCMTYFTKDSE